VTAVPLPASMAEVELGVRAVAATSGGPRHLHAWLRERQGVAVRLNAVAWEPLVPSADPRAAGFRRDGLDPNGIARTFGSTLLPPHGTLNARPILLPDLSVPLVLKVVGTDSSGRRIAAWAEIPPVRDDEEETVDCNGHAGP
jgi:hypothetical protein